MKNLSNFLVKKRIPILIVMMVIALISLILIPRVSINTDLTVYLPPASSMKQGLDLLKEEFPDLKTPNTIRVRFSNLPEEEKEAMRDRLAAIPYVDSVSWSALSEDYNKGSETLFTLNILYNFSSPEMKSIEKTLLSEFQEPYPMYLAIDDTAGGRVPAWIVAIAIVLIVIIMIVMSASWVEPFLCLFSIGMAILINTGSCALTGMISNTTWSVAAILQLVLSIDYSVILMNRYRQELSLCADPETAMTNAVSRAFYAISGSALTTIAGLLALLFMNFRIGADMGVMLAKGVAISMLCILTIMPALVLLCEKWIRRTAKPVPKIPMKSLGQISSRMRYPALVLLLALFVITFFLKASTDIAFTMSEPTEVDSVFPKMNQTIVLYANEDEESVSALLPDLTAQECVVSVNAWGNTFGMTISRSELSTMIHSSAVKEMVGDLIVPEAALDLLYLPLAGTSEDPSMTVEQLLKRVKELLNAGGVFLNLIGKDTASLAYDALDEVDAGMKQLRSDHVSVMAISTSLPDESEETFAFLDGLHESLSGACSSPFYIIGNSAMAREMSSTFTEETSRVTILTAAAVFLVVLFTFRSIVIPAVLVLLIQTSVFATMVIVHLQGYSIYYLALLVVQSILMGAAIDYAIVLTGYYRELRDRMNITESLIGAYELSIHTILTSGSIMVLVTVVLGYAFTNPAIGQICLTISKGAACALFLILFILPGVIAALDRFVCRKK